MRADWLSLGALACVVVLGCGPAGRGGRDDSTGDDTTTTDGGSGDTGRACDAGSSIACTCDDGSAGQAACVSDGSRYGVCNCSGETACTPEATEACTCTNGDTGVATCLENGSRFGVCDCSAPVQVCVPDATATCSCANGGTGTMSCLGDGSGYGACACPTGCGSARHDGGDGSCVPNGSCSAGYELQSNGSCAAAPTCETSGPSALINYPASPVVNATVQLDGSGSTGSGLSFAWLLTTPAGATSALAPIARPTFLAQTAGSYTAALTVTDPRGCQSSTTATIAVSGGGATGTSHGLQVQLNWTGESVLAPNVGDMDLHLVAPTPTGAPGTFFDLGNAAQVELMCLLGGFGGTGLPLESGTDVFYSDVQPDWSATNVDSDCDNTNDPSLDKTSDWGGVSTPEEITWSKAFTGTFVVGAHYYCSRQNTAASGQTPVYSASFGGVHATVKVFVDGGLRTTWTSGRLTQRDLWQAGTINVTAAGITVSQSSLPVSKPPDDGSGTTGCTADNLSGR